MTNDWNRITLLLASLVAGCSEPSVTPCHEVTLATDRCDPAKVEFTLASTNAYYPLHVGSLTVLEGIEDGKQNRVERTVLAETKVIMGVPVHILEHKRFIDGQIYEIANNYYVETVDGDVCYFGEDVEFFENGQLKNTDGTWLAGKDGAKPGLIMPAAPVVGDAYFQEDAPGIAQDMGHIVALDGTDTLGGLPYKDIITIMDSNPLETCSTEETKRYAPGVGEVQDTVMSLVSFTAAPVVPCKPLTLNVSVCDPRTATFTLASTNPYYPLVVGSVVVLEGIEDGERHSVVRTVLADTKVVAGVPTHILEHKKFINDEIYEIARNYYVETTAGTVCYFGEDVEFFEDGEVLNTHGTWLAGFGGAMPGVIMPATLAVGDTYFQEQAPGLAQDMGQVREVGGTATYAGTTYNDLVTVDDTNPLANACSAPEEKRYARGIGEVQDTVLRMVSHTP